MITLISGTNRPNSRTALVTELYSDILKSKNIEHKVLKLTDLDPEFYHPQMYDGDHSNPKLIELQEEFILPATKFFILTPEYNGLFPGIFKLLIDALCARKYKENFHGKKICLTGVAAGRAGNLRGMESITGFMNYLGATVYPLKLPISSIEGIIENNKITNQGIIKTIEDHIDGFLAF